MTEVVPTVENGPPRCVFCDVELRGGKNGNKSKEHAIPRWLQRRIGMVGLSSRFTVGNIYTGPERNMTHTLETVVAKQVCTSCNSGWMSDMEGRAMPVFERLFCGETSLRNLSESEQAILAKWAFKTSLTLIMAAPIHDKHPPEHHFGRLPYDDELPRGVHVVAASVTAQGGRPFGALVIGRLSGLRTEHGVPLTPDDMGDSYAVVIHVGNVAFAVVHCAAPYHALILNRDWHWPLGRPLDEYAWYGKAVFERKVHDGAAFYEHFVRSMAIAGGIPIGLDILHFNDETYAMAGPPDSRSEIARNHGRRVT